MIHSSRVPLGLPCHSLDKELLGEVHSKSSDTQRDLSHFVGVLVSTVWEYFPREFAF
jgi:hypothetical protein